MSSIEDRIAEVLRKHRRYEDGLGPLNACVCGRIGRHTEHQAAEVVAALEKPDGGYDDGSRWGIGYRAGLMEGLCRAEHAVQDRRRTTFPDGWERTE